MIPRNPEEPPIPEGKEDKEEMTILEALQWVEGLVSEETLQPEDFDELTSDILDPDEPQHAVENTLNFVYGRLLEYGVDPDAIFEEQGIVE